MSTARLGIFSLVTSVLTTGCFPYFFIPKKDKPAEGPKATQPTYGEYFKILSKQEKPVGTIPGDFSVPMGEIPEMYRQHEDGEFFAHMMGVAPGQTSAIDGRHSLAFHSSTAEKICFRDWSGEDAKIDDTPKLIEQNWSSGKPWLFFAVADLADLATLPTWPAPDGATRFDEITLEKEHKEASEDDDGVVRVKRQRFYKLCAPRPRNLDKATAIVIQIHKEAVSENESFGYDFIKEDPKAFERERMDSDGIYVWQIEK